MNSEELELSLRSDFEGHIKTILAEVKQEAADFQLKIDAELEKHRAHLNEALESFSSRISSERPLDQAFSGTVIEYLRLARDEGARITADAMAEAEAFAQSSAQPARYDQIRDAINDISCQTSQSSILSSLIHNAETFASRGAFFIVRNEHFVGWQVIGNDGQPDESQIRQLSFPISSETILGEAVRRLKPVRRTSPAHDDELFLDHLGFQRPGSMFAVPLIARGRGVAVLYADDGGVGLDGNLDALEMIVRVASLTVELLASNQTARPQSQPEQVDAVSEAEPVREETREPETPHVPAAMESPSQQQPVEQFVPDRSFEESVPLEEERVDGVYDHAGIDVVVNETAEYTSPVEEIADSESVQDLEETTIDAVEAEIVPEVIAEEPAYAEPEKTTDFAFGSGESFAPIASSSESRSPVEEPASNGNGHAVVLEPPVAAIVQRPSERRAGERRIDLPIEVSEEERSPHTKARRFARLLVSEIKLYNEQKVKDGREAGDLYDRLREAIDRSREMYDKRVEAPVASRFDYFHYELVNDLAQGDESRLGGGYPGASI